MDVTDDTHPLDVLRGLNELRKQAELTDVVLEVEGRSFPCHRAVLASCSSYFCGMFTSGYAEAKQERISIQDVSGVAMATILDYAYTGCLQTEPDQVQAVMSAARLLQVDFVCRKVAEYMKDHLDVFNCVDVLMYADMLGDLALVEAGRKYIASRFNQVALQPSFLQLPFPQLQLVLNRDDLMTNNSENGIVQAAMRWIEFDEERLQHLPVLCESFRHSFISKKVRSELASKCLSTGCKLVYSDSTTERLGESRSKMQIFIVEDFCDLTETPLTSAPCYDPSSGKLYKMKMPDCVRDYSMVVTPGDELYLAGHFCGIRNGLEVDTQKAFLQYNHLLNTWESRCEMISPRNRCGLVYLRGYIYAIGGNRESSVERYDPSCDSWTSIASLPSPVSSPCAVSLDDSIYVISGKGCYRYSTTENTWEKIADMLTTDSQDHRVVEYEGRIYCVYRWDSISSSLEIYSPEDGTWKFSGNDEPFYRQCDYAMLTVCNTSSGRSLYLITECSYDGFPKIYLYKYQEWNDTWIKQDSKDKMIPPLSQWLEYKSKTECLVARMIPTCLGDGSSYKDKEQATGFTHRGSDYTSEEESDHYWSDY